MSMNDLVQAIASKEAEGSLAPEERKLFKKVYKKRVKGWNNFLTSGLPITLRMIKSMK